MRHPAITVRCSQVNSTIDNVYDCHVLVICLVARYPHSITRRKKSLFYQDFIRESRCYNMQMRWYIVEERTKKSSDVLTSFA